MSDARRKIQQGGVRLNGQKADLSRGHEAELEGMTEYVLQVGKHAAVRVRRQG